jgi:hypothetical protein
MHSTIQFITTSFCLISKNTKIRTIQWREVCTEKDERMRIPGTPEQRWEDNIKIGGIMWLR